MQHVFNWTREALLLPLEPGSAVIAVSSGAAVNGSPLSGGYAGAKATIRFIASYATEESDRNGLGIRFTCVLPQLTPETGLGAAAVAAYAARQGVGIPAFLDRLGPVPLEYSIIWLACAFASRRDVVLVSLPGAAQDRLRAHVPGAQPGRPGVPRGPGEGC